MIKLVSGQVNVLIASGSARFPNGFGVGLRQERSERGAEQTSAGTARGYDRPRTTHGAQEGAEPVLRETCGRDTPVKGVSRPQVPGHPGAAPRVTSPGVPGRGQR